MLTQVVNNTAIAIAVIIMAICFCFPYNADLLIRAAL